MAADKLLIRDNMKSAIAATGLPRSLRFHRSETSFGKPVRPPQRQNDGSEREGGCRRSFGRRPENCFGKPDGPAQRQNNGACACDGAGLPWLSRKLRPSSGKLFREATGQLPAPKLRKRAQATRPSEAWQNGHCGWPALIKLQFSKPLIKMARLDR